MDHGFAAKFEIRKVPGQHATAAAEAAGSWQCGRSRQESGVVVTMLRQLEQYL